MAKVRPVLEHNSVFSSSEKDLLCEEFSKTYRKERKSSIPSFRMRTVSISNPCRVRWDVIIILLALYNCFLIPYRISFGLNFKYSMVLDAINILIDLIFIFDIFLNFRTSYIDLKTGEEITNPKLIAKNYLKNGRLFMDVLACIPVDLITLMFNDTPGIILIKILKLSRILRLRNIIFYMRIKEDLKISLRISNLILFMMIYFHFLACLWNYVISRDEVWAFPAHTSISKGVSLYDDYSELSRYIFCFYVGMSTLVGIELFPVDNTTYVLSAILIIFGTMLITYLLGEISVLVFNLNLKSSQFFRRMDTVSNIMKRLKLSKSLQFEISEYFAATYHLLLRNREWEEFQRVLPPSFVEDINEFLYEDIVLEHAIFHDLNLNVKEVLSHLENSFLRPGDYLIRAGDESKQLFFIVQGRCEVWVEGLDHTDYLANDIKDGDICGEIGLLFGIRRTACIRAFSYTTAGGLPQDIFKKILTEEMEMRMKKHISMYKDPRRVDLIKLLRKIGYLNKLDRTTLDTLLYSLETVFVEKNGAVFDEGDRANHIYFLIDGSVSLYTNVYDHELFDRIGEKNKLLRKINSKALTKSYSQIDKFPSHILMTGKNVLLRLVRLNHRAVICANQALFRQRMHIACFANTNATLMILKSEVIQRILKEKLQFKMSVNAVKKKYTHYNKLFNECVIIPPELDCFQDLLSEHIRLSWKAKVKFKNAVLMIIARNRNRISSSLIELRSAIHRLCAVIEAENQGFGEIARLIERKSISATALPLAQMLSFEEMGKAILNQFSFLSQDSLHFNQSLESNILLMRKMLNISKRRRGRVLVRIHEVNQIADLVSSYVN